MEKYILNKNLKVYNQLASEYESKVGGLRRVSRPVIKKFLKYVKHRKYFLDIGCSIGVHMQMFKELGFNVEGIDISDEMVKRARIRNPTSKIIRGDFMTTKFNKKFDAIYAQAFIHLYPKSDVKRVMKKMKSLLKKEGVLFITTSKEKESKEGFFTKKNYSSKEKRFRGFWTKNELNNVLSKEFRILKYFEAKNPSGDTWMCFVLGK